MANICMILCHRWKSEIYQIVVLFINVHFMDFLGFTPPPSLNSEIRRCARLLGEPLGLRGKEVVFSDGAGFEP